MTEEEMQTLEPVGEPIEADPQGKIPNQVWLIYKDGVYEMRVGDDYTSEEGTLVNSYECKRARKVPKEASNAVQVFKRYNPTVNFVGVVRRPE